MIEKFPGINAALATPTHATGIPPTEGPSSTALADHAGKSQNLDHRAGTSSKVKAASAKQADTKTETVLKKLRLARGATVEQIMEETGWQAHSVRGFLSAVIRKKLGLNLASDVGKDGRRRYRVIPAGGESA
jgi:hypothetical protein